MRAKNIKHIHFFNMCPRTHSLSQGMDFSNLALHISASAQDIKILKMIYIPQPSLIMTRKIIMTMDYDQKDLKLVKNCKKRYISLNDQCEMYNCDL